jgi:hypothetical protein
MSIRIGIYDFFAYTIPGALYLFGVLFLVQRFRFITLNLTTTSASLTEFVIFGALSYVAGLIFDPLASRLYTLFAPRKLFATVFEELNTTNPNTPKHFKKTVDWYILLGYIKHSNLEMGLEIEQLNAMHIMLRNISFAAFIFSLLPIVELTQASFLPWHAIFSVSSIVISIIAFKQAVKFRRWFYSAICKTVIAIGLETSDLLTKKELSSSESLKPSNDKTLK